MITIIYIFDDRCVNCQAIQEQWEAFKRGNRGRAAFRQVLATDDIRARYGIDAVPAFVAQDENGQVITKVIGGDFTRLQGIINNQQGSPPAGDPKPSNNILIVGGLTLLGAIIFFNR